MEAHAIRRGLTGLGVLAAHPAAFGIVAIYAVLWFFFQRDTFDWHAVALLATWCMTLVIHRSVYRDNQALQAKLDELLRVHGDARNELTKLDQQTATSRRKRTRSRPTSSRRTLPCKKPM